MPPKRQNQQGGQQQQKTQSVFEVSNIVTMVTMYKFDIFMIAKNRNGSLKTNSPFVIYHKGVKLVENRSTKDQGEILIAGKTIDYVEGEKEMTLHVIFEDGQLQFSKTFPLPAPSSIEHECELEQTATGYTATIKGRVMSDGSPRPKAHVSWSGNGQSGKATIGKDGSFEFQDPSIDKSMVGKSIVYTIKVGNLLTEECRVEIPSVARIEASSSFISTKFGYIVTVTAKVFDKNGPMKNCPVRCEGNRATERITDGNGNAVIRDFIPLFMAKGKITYVFYAGNKDEEHTVDIPAVTRIDASSSYVATATGYKITVNAKVLNKDGWFANCPFKWTGNGKSGDGKTDANGDLKFEDDVPAGAAGKSFGYTIMAGGKVETCQAKISEILEIEERGSFSSNSSYYFVSAEARVRDKDGIVKNCPITCDGIYGTDDGTTDADGKFAILDVVPLTSLGKELVYTFRAGNKAKECRIKLPALTKIVPSCDISSIDDGYRITLKAIAYSGLAPLANCPISWSGNKASGIGITDANGAFSHQIDIGREKIGDKITFNVSAGFLTEKAEVLVPRWKHPDTYGGLKSYEAFHELLSRSPNWKEHWEDISVYVFKTIGIFLSVAVIARIMPRGLSFIAFFVMGFLMWYNKDKDGARGVWRPFIATSVCLVLMDSIYFICFFMIASLPVYVYEELTVDIDPITKKRGHHKSNPYPKYPILFAILMAMLLFAIKANDLHASHESFLHIITTNCKYTFGILANHQDHLSRMAKIKLSLTSVLNWLASALVLFLYATPAEILELIMPGVSVSSGKFTGIAGLYIGIKDVIHSLLRLGRKVGR